MSQFFRPTIPRRHAPGGFYIRFKSLCYHYLVKQTNILNYFRDQGWLDDRGFSLEGKDALADLLEILPDINKDRWGSRLFVSLLKKCVPASVELVIVKNGKVLLIHREDAYFKGFHTPGSYLGPDEDWQTAASRIAKQEVGCDVKVERYVTSFFNTDNPRFVDLSNLILCRIEDEPTNGEWFEQLPDDMIPMHRKFWPSIESVLRD